MQSSVKQLIRISTHYSAFILYVQYITAQTAYIKSVWNKTKS